MLDEALLAFVSESLPARPARVLEVGAGSGELAARLASDGYDVVAIDPAGDAPHVQAVRLHEFQAPAASFDAALAVVSLHHVEPLAESCRQLASLVRAGGRLVIDEFDIARFDVDAARWWLGQAPAIDEHGHDHERDPQGIADDLREHLHPLSRVLAALDPWFEFSEVERGPYLYRWALGPEFREAEEREIAGGGLRATGARVVGRRRDDRSVGD